MERAVDENLTAGGAVGELKLFVGSEEVDGVGARHGAAPEGVDADFLLRPLARVPLPAVDGAQGVLRVHGLDQELRRAAGGVFFLVVVGFRQLNVEVGFQNAGDFFQGPDQDRHAQGVVGGPEDRGSGAQAFQLAEFVGAEPGGAGEKGGPGAADVGGDFGEGAGTGEVDHYVGDLA